jgi:hypothetical protein
MNYSKEAILKLSEVVESNSAEAFKWLTFHKHRELLLFKEAVLFKKEAEDWLIQNKHFVLAAFVAAVHGDEKAFQFLMKHKLVQWAATVNATNGDKAAIKWLEKNGFSQFAALSEKFFEKFKEHSERNTAAFYKGPFSD